jgi:UDP-N-acetylmuramoyl-tripeptide--D-alanyl-D-alanine ligase
LLARGIDPSEHQLQDALEGLSLPQGRWREVQIGELSLIDDAYNANPSSVKASVEAFMSLDQVGLRLAVIGEMRELGKDSKTIHEDVARHLAAKPGLDGVAFVGLYARAMAEAAREGASAGKFFAFDAVDDVVTWLEGQGEAVVFLKASRGSRLERIITMLQDRDVRS